MKRCKSCGAEIEWVFTAATGKLMPIDLPGEKRLVIEELLQGRVARVVQTYVSHFATCPNADSHRRKSGDRE